jgi:hypothetical protein
MVRTEWTTDRQLLRDLVVVDATDLSAGDEEAGRRPAGPRDAAVYERHLPWMQVFKCDNLACGVGDDGVVADTGHRRSVTEAELIARMALGGGAGSCGTGCRAG